MPVLVILLVGSVWVDGNLHVIVGYNVTATSGLPNEEQGLATGLATTTRQVALTVGIPIMSAIASTRRDGLSRTDHSPSDALMGGFHPAMWADAVNLLVGTALLAPGLLRRARER